MPGVSFASMFCPILTSALADHLPCGSCSLKVKTCSLFCVVCSKLMTGVRLCTISLWCRNSTSSPMWAWGVSVWITKDIEEDAAAVFSISALPFFKV